MIKPKTRRIKPYTSDIPPINFEDSDFGNYIMPFVRSGEEPVCPVETFGVSPCTLWLHSLYAGSAGSLALKKSVD